MKRGVEIRLDTRLAGATADAGVLAGGERIADPDARQHRALGAESAGRRAAFKKERGRLVADATWSCLTIRASGRSGGLRAT